MSNYATEAELDTLATYSMTGNAIWSAASAGDKAIAMAHASRILNRLNFVGSKTSDSQELEFPRGEDETEIPDGIKEAYADIVFALLDGVDPDAEQELLSVSSTAYQGVRTTYDRSIVQEHVVAGVPSASAWLKLKPYLRDSRSVTLERT